MTNDVQRRTRTHRWAVVFLVLLAGCLPGANWDPKSGSGTAPEAFTPVLTDVRTGVHTEEGGFDRVVLEFHHQVPPYQVRYVDKPIIADGSGAVVPLAGNFAVEIRMSPASQVLALPSRYVPLFAPQRLTPNHPEVVELVNNGDFEAVLHWTVGTTHQNPFRVTTMTNPPRLVVDFQH